MAKALEIDEKRIYSDDDKCKDLIDFMVNLNPLVIKYVFGAYKDKEFYLKYKEKIDLIKDNLINDYELSQFMREETLLEKIYQKDERENHSEDILLKNQESDIIIRKNRGVRKKQKI